MKNLNNFAEFGTITTIKSFKFSPVLTFFWIKKTNNHIRHPRSKIASVTNKIMLHISSSLHWKIHLRPNRVKVELSTSLHQNAAIFPNLHNQIFFSLLPLRSQLLFLRWNVWIFCRSTGKFATNYNGKAVAVSTLKHKEGYKRSKLIRGGNFGWKAKVEACGLQFLLGSDPRI